jgi:hypothetical protein
MSLHKLANELERYASLHGVEIYVDETALKNSFVPVINEDGVVGAIGEYVEKSKHKVGYFILNNSVVRYALAEGFNVNDIYDKFKASIFKETDKKDFFDIMVKKK